MKTNIDIILDAKEKRIETIKSFLTSNSAVIVMKANVPGENKHIVESHIAQRIISRVVADIITVEKTIFKEEDDGYCYYFLVQKEIGLKKQLVDIEETHPLGRFVDLDLFLEPTQSLTRGDLGLRMRQCFLCEQDVIFCMRRNTHSLKELITHFTTRIHMYLDGLIRQIILDSMYCELNLEDKFGLITPTSQGSHQDMDYAMMVRCMPIVVDHLMMMFWAGFEKDTIQEAYTVSKKIGLDAEKEMLQVTGGINTYKGLIFILGLVVMATGHGLKNKLPITNLFDYIAEATKHVFSEPKYSTFGETAWKKWQFGGARKEAYLGMPTIQKALRLASTFKQLDEDALRFLLADIIFQAEDTVLLKRAKTMYRYDMFKEKIKEIPYKDHVQAKKITQYCIDHNISCGGSADLLVATIFIHTMSKKI